LKGGHFSASSGISEKQQSEYIVSENVNDESTVSQDQENGSSLLQFDHSTINEEIGEAE
jgi:hypothetical protein